ncbi:MAG: hypothetical protein ACREIV_14245, partial [Planctomycetaceae bacterium]
MTFILGTALAGESTRAMVSGFPVDLFVLPTGVTYLFGVAGTNGTVERIVDGAAARRVADRVAGGAVASAAIPQLSVSSWRRRGGGPPGLFRPADHDPRANAAARARSYVRTRSTPCRMQQARCRT